MTNRRYNLLRIPLKHDIHIHAQLQNSLCNALDIQRNKVIDYKLRINLINKVFHMAQRYVTIITPQKPPSNPH